MAGRRFCQDGRVSSQRTLIALTMMTMVVTGCAGAPDEPLAEPTWVATPRVDATTSTPASPSVTPTSTPAPSASTARPTTTAKAPAKQPAAAARPTRQATSAARYVFPVSAANASWHKTHGKYAATDIFASCGKPVLAVTKGVVLEVSRKDNYVKGRPDGPLNGGLSVSLLGDDGVRYYGSHLSEVQSGIRAGVRVAAGQQIGRLGRTGNANGVCHLHFGISPKCAGTGDWKVRRGVVWPYSYLASWRDKGSKSPVSAVAAWERSHNCKA